MTTSGKLAIKGQTLSFKSDPFATGVDDCIAFEADGAVIIEDGMIIDVGPAGPVLARHPGVPVDHFDNHLIMAGFIDSHTHYPQTSVIASYGEQLLSWLERYTFPAEAKFGNRPHADRAATVFLDECLRNGITTSSVYCTVHPQSVEALFEAAHGRGMRVAAGKVLMDRNAPENLTDTAQLAYDQTAELIKRWHQKGRCVYAITPRFAPTSTPGQLEAAGQLWKEHPTTLMQTHLSENHSEIAWVKELFPDCVDYLSVYERFGLVGKGANFGHGLHLNDREIGVLREAGAGISHCPTSNTFIGSGLFDLDGLRDCANPITTGLATDVGGGTSFSMFDTMKSAYEVGHLRGYSLHPAKAYYLATLGSATLMNMGDKVGNLAVGYEADIQIIDLTSKPIIAERMRHADDLFEVLFLQMILADDRAVRRVYIGGQTAYDRDDA